MLRFLTFSLVCALCTASPTRSGADSYQTSASASAVPAIEITTKEPKVFTGQGCSEDQLFRDVFQPKIQEQIAADVGKIINYITNGKQRGKTYQELATFVDRFGSRFTGTKNLEDSIDYILKKLQDEGHDNVHGEKVAVPKWTRGNEWVQMVQPRQHKLNVLGLGYSVGTEGRTIEAPVVVVRSFDELEQKSHEVSGKIVVYNNPFETYGKSVVYRTDGASRASQYGAIAALIRSVTPFSIASPHTGMQTYQSNVTKIPAISITVEDAELLQRFYDRKEQVVVRIYSENHLDESPVVSRNVVSEIKGTVKPDEVVVVGGHIDSWDVGQGAMDDGAGAFISWRALSVIKELGLKPKRTLRSVLWTAEEVGLIGAQSYVEQHKNELDKFVIAMESDIGTFTPNGLTFSGQNSTAQCVMWELLRLMHPINATRLTIHPEGSDVQVFLDQGVPISSLDTQNDKYFYYHHTEADTMSVENEDDLDKCLAVWTSISYALASLEFPLPNGH